MSAPKCLFFPGFRGAWPKFWARTSARMTPGCPRDIRPENFLFGLLFCSWDMESRTEKVSHRNVQQTNPLSGSGLDYQNSCQEIVSRVSQACVAFLRCFRKENVRKWCFRKGDLLLFLPCSHKDAVAHSYIYIAFKNLCFSCVASWVVFRNKNFFWSNSSIATKLCFSFRNPCLQKCEKLVFLVLLILLLLSVLLWENTILVVLSEKFQTAHFDKKGSFWTVRFWPK